MTTRLVASPVTSPCTRHGEGPVWFADRGVLEFVDMLEGDVVTLRADGTLARRHIAGVAAVVRGRRGGGYIYAVEDGFLREDAAGRRDRIRVFDDPTVRMNEGACDHGGRFYAGSMALDATPGRGRLYRLDAEGAVDVVLDAVTISNGLAFTPDDAVAVYVDTATGAIRRYDTATRPWTLIEDWVRIDPDLGAPDGLCLDAEGAVWVALWDGSRVQRYDGDGRLTHEVTLPVGRPTACALGGDDLRTLYVTSSRHGSDAPEPLAGAVFSVRVDVPGLAPDAFAG